MAIYSIESAMKTYNIKNDSIKKLEKALLDKENFIGVITMYNFNLKDIEGEFIYTDKKSFDKDKNDYLENDYPFRSKIVQDRNREIQRER